MSSASFSPYGTTEFTAWAGCLVAAAPHPPRRPPGHESDQSRSCSEAAGRGRRFPDAGPAPSHPPDPGGADGLVHDAVRGWVPQGGGVRCLDRYREAIKPLEAAAAVRPGDTQVALALGWCYKRSNRLAQAIDALERALREHSDEPLLHYNLACYWSLAGNSARRSTLSPRRWTSIRNSAPSSSRSRISINSGGIPSSIASSWGQRP